MQTTTPSVSQPFAPPASAEAQRGALHGIWSHGRDFCRRCWAIARCECILQTRSIVFWVMLAVFTLLTILDARGQVSSTTIYMSDGDAAVATCAYTTSFLFFLLPFLHANTFLRDRLRKVQSLVWSRPLTSWEYALGKGIGAIGINLVLTWLPLFAGWITVSMARGSVQPIGIWLLLALAVSGAVILITGASLLLIAITSPAGLLGALMVAAPITYMDIVSPKSMLWLNNLTGQTLFVSPTIGFGLDTPLLFWQRFSYLLGGLFFLLLAVLFVQLRERLGVARWYHLLCTLLLLLLVGGTAISSIVTFQQIGASYTNVGAVTTKPAQATTSHFTIAVQADPGNGSVQGTSSFLLTPAPSLSNSFIIGLNPGLHVQHVSAQTPTGDNKQSLAFSEISPGWTSIHVAGTPLASGQPLKLTIVYGGSMLFSRDDYAMAKGGYGIQHAIGTSWTLDFYYLSYLGRGTGELLGAAGSWYPLPYTQQALDAGTRITVDQLQLQLPTSYKVWNGLSQGTWTTRGNWHVLTAQPHTGLPVALVAALSNPQKDNANNFWYQGGAPDATELLTDQVLIKEAQNLNTWLAPHTMPTTFQTVIVPMLPFPVVGDGLLLLPDALYSSAYGEGGLMGGSPYTREAIARIMGFQLAYNWWLNADEFPFAMPSGGGDTQNPNPSTAPTPVDAILDMLGSYSAVVITDQTIGGHFYAQEMSICSQIFKLDSANSGSTNYQMDPHYQALQHAATNLGTTCGGLELLPDKLAQTRGVGFSGLTTFLQQYAQAHVQQKVDMRQFLQKASKLVGFDITNQAAPYICPGNPKIPTGSNGTSDPLSCLNMQYAGT